MISENEDDELIQTRRKRADEFISRYSRRPQLPKGQQEHRWSKIEWIDQPTFIKEIITSLKEKWIHGYQNMTVMSNRIKIVSTKIPQNINSNKTSMMLLAKIYGNSRNQLSVPIFDGNKRNYNKWKAAFMACIDQAPVIAEYKLLQLRQYLSGEILKAIENLGRSAAAYQITKERL